MENELVYSLGSLSERLKMVRYIPADTHSLPGRIAYGPVGVKLDRNHVSVLFDSGRYRSTY